MTQGSETFVEPTSLEQAESLRATITDDVQSIQSQLGDRQRTDDDGNRLTSKQYWAWKRRAAHSLNQKLAELRKVKSWIREHRQAEAPSSEVILEHLSRLYRILDDLRNQDVDLDPGELTQIDAAKDVLLRAGVPLQPAAA